MNKDEHILFFSVAQKEVCELEWNTVKISCPAGQRIIVVKATYGGYDKCSSHLCQPHCQHLFDQTHSANVINDVPVDRLLNEEVGLNNNPFLDAMDSGVVLLKPQMPTLETHILVFEKNFTSDTIAHP